MRNLIIGSVVLTCGVAIAGCSDAVGVGSGARTELSFMTGSSSALAARANSIPITSGGHTLDLQTVTLAVTKVELERTSGGTCMSENEGDDDNDSSHDHDCEEVKIGPTNVELQMSGGLTTIIGPALPPGTYREIEVRISTVRFRGTYDSQPFDVTLDVHVRPEVTLDPPLVVTDATPTSITVNVPLVNWFVNLDGSTINPALLASNATLAAAIRARIATSLRAFEDRDHDGDDDHHRHGRD